MIDRQFCAQLKTVLGSVSPRDCMQLENTIGSDFLILLFSYIYIYIMYLFLQSQHNSATAVNIEL